MTEGTRYVQFQISEIFDMQNETFFSLVQLQTKLRNIEGTSRVQSLTNKESSVILITIYCNLKSNENFVTQDYEVKRNLKSRITTLLKCDFNRLLSIGRFALTIGFIDFNKKERILHEIFAINVG